MPDPRRRAPVVAVRLSGPGLFTGGQANLTISGGMFDGGLVFVREDLEGKHRCAATTEALTTKPVHPAFASMAARSTNLQTTTGQMVGTVEHILSALDAMDVVDATLEIDAPEVPFVDGCAAEYVHMLEFCDLDDEGPMEVLTLPHAIEVVDERDPTARVVATPRAQAGRSFRYDLDYTTISGPLAKDAAAIPTQSAAWDGAPESYISDIAPARTFCLKGEYEAMRAAGLLESVPDDAAVVFGPSGPVNTTLRFPNEPARHKLLDLIGDLALIGARVQMDVHATKSGHALNHRLARAIRQAVVGPRKS